MFIGAIAMEWLSGRWLPSQYVSPNGVNDSLTDIFGQAITVGSKVKLIGTVVSLNPSDPHFQDVVISPDYPQRGVIDPQSGVFPQNIPVKQYTFHPLQLVVVKGSL